MVEFICRPLISSVRSSRLPGGIPDGVIMRTFHEKLAVDVLRFGTKSVELFNADNGAGPVAFGALVSLLPSLEMTSMNWTEPISFVMWRVQFSG